MTTGRILSTCCRLSHTWKSTPKFKQFSGVISRKMHIQAIPMFSDNYAYVLSDEKSRDAFIVDPASPQEVRPVLEELSQLQGLKFRGILTTHHHADHAGGNSMVHGFLQKLAQANGYQLFSDNDGKDYSVIGGGPKVQALTHTIAHSDVLTLPGDRITLTALHTPCHTQDSVCYYVQDGDQRAVFTGDTLFIGGCGRFFEGKPIEMNRALNVILASLPHDTKVYPGHEYTKANVKFCLSISDAEPIKKLAALTAQHHQTPGRSTIGDEKLHNVFMMVGDPAIQNQLGTKDSDSAMATMRTMKNRS